MAVINPTVEKLGGNEDAVKYTWVLANGDTGAPVRNVQWADRSVQVSGTFGTGGSVNWEGSNNESTYIVLTDPQGNAITITTARLEAVTEITALARPNVTAGDGTTALTVVLVARRAQQLQNR